MTEPAPPCVCCQQKPGTRYRLCPGCFVTVALPCYGKMPIRDLRYATRVARYTKPHMVAYQCPVCSRYHTGRITTERSTTNGHRSATLIRQIRANGYGWVITHLTEVLPHLDRETWKKQPYTHDPTGGTRDAA